MKNFLALFIILCSVGSIRSQVILENWKFKTGDDMAWANPAFNDSEWATIKGNTVYENQGYDYNGYSWYRVSFRLPSSIRQQSYMKDSLRVIVGRVDDIDATYLNGQKIGGIGKFPEEPGGPAGHYDALRRYALPWNHPAIKWDAENVIAVRFFDGGGGGGLWGMIPNVGMVDLIDFLSLNIDAGGFEYQKDGTIKKTLKVENKFNSTAEGVLSLKLQPKKGKSITYNEPISIGAGSVASHTFTFPAQENATVTYTFSEKNTAKTLKAKQITPYILTPKEKPEPKITNALVYGSLPNRPFQWSLTATGKRPMTFTARGLPSGLKLNEANGLITGVPGTKGEFEVELSAVNAHGKATQKVKVIIGDKINLTPPLGWNSWNCWGMAVSDQRVKQSANAMVSSGLVNHGWTYINVDDGWQGDRNAAGVLQPNDKFPDMKQLGDYLHSNGLKFGIYSSPGDKSCGGLPATLNHEETDVKTWASWGLDYIKYDWCSYTQFLENQGKTMKQWTVEEQILPFKKLSDAIEKSGRNITHSVCNWGMGEAWKWGARTGGQLWRTTGDIEDSWASMSSIGFSQAEASKYTHPGGWGDPDMLIVGWVGWGDKLHQTRLSPAEQYTHISLWAMLSAPMMIGCDISRLDDFTYNLLANDEVLAINQDPLGKAATQVLSNKDTQIWVKELNNGNKALAVFNLTENDRKIPIDLKQLGLSGFKQLRDAWRQKDLGKMKAGMTTKVEGHGVMLYLLEK